MGAIELARNLIIIHSVVYLVFSIILFSNPLIYIQTLLILVSKLNGINSGFAPVFKERPTHYG